MTLVSLNGSTNGSARGGRTADPSHRRPCRAPVRSTADRVSVAWHHSHPLARHSLVAAFATSFALALSMRVPAIVAGTTAMVGALLAVAALVDAHQRRLPNRLLVTAMAFALGGAVLSFDGAVVVNAVLGMLVAGGLLLSVRLTRGIGMGDVKMAAVVGASAGASTTSMLAAPVAIAIAALAGAAYGSVTNRHRVPLGPSLWLGWAAILVVHSFVDATRWLS